MATIPPWPADDSAGVYDYFKQLLPRDQPADRLDPRSKSHHVLECYIVERNLLETTEQNCSGAGAASDLKNEELGPSRNGLSRRRRDDRHYFPREEVRGSGGLAAYLRSSEAAIDEGTAAVSSTGPVRPARAVSRCGLRACITLCGKPSERDRLSWKRRAREVIITACWSATERTPSSRIWPSRRCGRARRTPVGHADSRTTTRWSHVSVAWARESSRSWTNGILDAAVIQEARRFSRRGAEPRVIDLCSWARLSSRAGVSLATLR